MHNARGEDVPQDRSRSGQRTLDQGSGGLAIEPAHDSRLNGLHHRSHEFHRRRATIGGLGDLLVDDGPHLGLLELRRQVLLQNGEFGLLGLGQLVTASVPVGLGGVLANVDLLVMMACSWSSVSSRAESPATSSAEMAEMAMRMADLAMSSWAFMAATRSDFS